MKKLISLLMLCSLMALFVMSCESAEQKKLKQLKKEVAAANKDCPLVYMPGLVVESVKYSDKTNEVICTYSLGEELSEILQTNTDKSVLKETFGLSLLQSSVKPFSKLIEEAGAGIALRFEFKDGNKPMEFRYSNDEIKSLSSKFMSDSEIKNKILKLNIESSNAQCPIQVDEVTTMTAVAIEDNCVIYTYRMEEDEQFNLSYVRETYDEARENVLAESKSDPLVGRSIKQLADLGYGLQLRFTGSASPDTVTFTYTPQELKYALH